MTTTDTATNNFIRQFKRKPKGVQDVLDALVALGAMIISGVWTE